MADAARRPCAKQMSGFRRLVSAPTMPRGSFASSSAHTFARCRLRLVPGLSPTPILDCQGWPCAQPTNQGAHRGDAAPRVARRIGARSLTLLCSRLLCPQNFLIGMLARLDVRAPEALATLGGGKWVARPQPMVGSNNAAHLSSTWSTSTPAEGRGCHRQLVLL